MPARPRRGLLVVISGPSGAGKTSIARALEERLGGRYSVSATTRPPGPGETGGRDYEFVTEQEFRDRVARGAFLEHAMVFGRHWYGTPRGPVDRALAAGDLVILAIDVQGALQVRRSMPEALLIFILPPDEAELRRRLAARGRDDPASMERRLAEARREIDIGLHGGTYDARVVNDDLERAIAETCAIVTARRGAP
jgi:guanylate kinase